MTIQRGIIAVSAILLFNTLVSLRTTSAQTVQLPVFRSFSVNTSVSVPDRGSTSLGGSASAYNRDTVRVAFHSAADTAAVGQDRQVRR
jgi:hypothetical protein